MRDYVRARLGLAPGVHAMPCANEIKQHPLLEEQQHAKHKMFSHSIWDVAKAAKGIRILLLTGVSCCPILLPPLPCGYHTSTCASLTARATSHRTVMTDRRATTGGLNSPRWSCPERDRKLLLAVPKGLPRSHIFVGLFRQPSVTARKPKKAIGFIVPKERAPGKPEQLK